MKLNKFFMLPTVMYALCKPKQFKDIFKLPLILLSLIWLSSCTPEKLVIPKQNNNEFFFLTQTIEVKNYNNSNVNFIIKPVKIPFVNNAKTTLSNSKQKDRASLYIYDIKTSLPHDTMPLQTKLIIKLNKDGSMTSTHFMNNHKLATLNFNIKGKLIKVIIPKKNNLKSDNSANDLTYDCINKEYQKLKIKVESDFANDLVCTITAPLCETMMVLSAVEICRGNVNY